MKKTLLLILVSLCSAITASARDFEFTYEGQTLTYTVIDENAKTCQVARSLSKVSGDLIIPEKVSDGSDEFKVIIIDDHAFSRCSEMTSIVIPPSVTSIGVYAFYNCSALTSVDIPNSVNSIGHDAFTKCSSLTSVEIPNSVTTIGNQAFTYCSSLTSIEIPNSVTEIGDLAFNECSSLTSVKIPNLVTEIGYSAFASCDEITEVEYLSQSPCSADRSIFSTTVYENATLRIPQGARDIFMETSPWNKFSIIVEKDPELSAIDKVEGEDIEAIDYSAPYDVYSLHGIRVSGALDGLEPGFYIVRQGEKVVKIALQ